MSTTDESKQPATISSPIEPEKPKEPIHLSAIAEALIHSFRAIRPKATPDDLSKLSVSQAVSFLALVYEKTRNAIEYREEHLIRRAAIERILKRRLTLNPEGSHEAENLLRELLWARYFPNEYLGSQDTVNIQKLIDKFIYIRKKVVSQAPVKEQSYVNEFLFHLITCEIEETLIPDQAKRESIFTYFIYQVLKRTIKVEGLSSERKDAYFLASIEQTYRKSDKPYQRYHMFIAFYKPTTEYTHAEIDDLSPKFLPIFRSIDNLTLDRTTIKLGRYVKKQLPPFLILFELFRKKTKEIASVVSEKNTLQEEIFTLCNEKYIQTQKKLRGLAIRSLIYIFITKMLFALILEYPVSMYLYNQVHILSIVINSLFPPMLMLVIILTIKVPGEDNTKRIFSRIMNILDKDDTFETQVAYITKQQKQRRPLLVFIFSIIYLATYLVTLMLINSLLNIMHFNIISKVIFVFFVSVVTYFSYRVRQIAGEYKLIERESALSPIIDFFFLPILSIGKFLSSELGKINIFIVIFDFFIEAPFKLIIDIIEEWTRFIKARKEEIV